MSTVAIPAPAPRARRGRPTWLRGPALVGVIAIVIWALVAITIPLWSPSDPLEAVGSRLRGPSLDHLMGTDQLGRDVFVRTLTEKLMIYGLGRGLQHYDMPVVREIVRKAERQNYRFSALIMGIVTSTPFQMRAAGDDDR